MKKIFLIATLLISSISFSQSGMKTTFNLIGGERFSSYVFHNSSQQKSNDIGYVMYNTFGINAELNLNRNIIRPGISFYQAGAKTLNSGTNINWRTSHLAFNLSYLYSAYDGKVFSLRPGLGFGFNYMLSGDQTIGSTRLNIITEKSLKRFDIEAFVSLNAKFQVTSLFSVGAEYRFGYGLLQIETDPQQKTSNINHCLLLNLGFTIAKGVGSRL